LGCFFFVFLLRFLLCFFFLFANFSKLWTLKAMNSHTHTHKKTNTKIKPRLIGKYFSLAQVQDPIYRIWNLFLEIPFVSWFENTIEREKKIEKKRARLSLIWFKNYSHCRFFFGTEKNIYKLKKNKAINK